MYDAYNAYLLRAEDIRNECLDQQRKFRPIKKVKRQKSRTNWYRRHLRKLA